jgi:ABC-type antimicrobial peptide transport system permease subunit
MAVVLVLMCVCMYFIMRSSLMNRIKEVGVYRAIGVSKKNLAFKFFVEAIVLCALTVFVGYLATSVFLYMAMGLSSLVEDLFFYPLWYAGAILAVIAAISLLFGTLPILSLLKKTPSEILATYDI